MSRGLITPGVSVEQAEISAPALRLCGGFVVIPEITRIAQNTQTHRRDAENAEKAQSESEILNLQFRSILCTPRDSPGSSPTARS